MSRMIVIDQGPIETRLARVENDQVVQLAHLYPGRQDILRGSLYHARVTQIDNRLNAAFCDLGGPQGFLRRQGRLAPKGSLIPVEVRREPIDDKGPDLTDRAVLRLPLVTLPIGHDPRPGPIEAGAEDYDAAVAQALDLAETFAQQDAPGSFEAVPDLIKAFTRLANGGVDEVAVTQASLKSVLASFLHGAVPIEVAELGPVRQLLDEAQEDALARRVDLPGGGRLVIDQAEALTAIDIDLGGQSGQSAKGASERLLTESLEALSWYARLSDLGGQIVVDVPRAAIAAPKIIRDRLTRTFRPLGRVGVPAVTPEGLCVVIAPRAGPSVLNRLTERAGGTVREGRNYRPDTAAAMAYRELEAALLADRASPQRLVCSKDILLYFAPGGPALTALEATYGPRITIVEEVPAHDNKNA
ncbi:MAG: ribonuclease E/G [Pseudomonadota bacterium]